MKTRVNLFILLGTILLLSSCGSETQLKDGDTIFFPDTTAFKNSWKMEERAMMNDLFEKETFYNQLGLDTFELSYSMCDCPDWIDRSKVHLDCKECSDFYIEAATSSLELPSNFHTSGNTVRFYGVLIPGKNLPQHREFTVPDPPAWTVIRYYGYEVVRPYQIWGPKMKEFQEPSDTLEYTLRLTIQ